MQIAKQLLTCKTCSYKNCYYYCSILNSYVNKHSTCNKYSDDDTKKLKLVYDSSQQVALNINS